MKRLALLAPFCLVLTAAIAFAQDGGEMDPEAMKIMQERAEEARALGEHHEALARLLGEWDVELALFMPGMPEQSSKGTARYDWVIEGRWMGQRVDAPFMGMEHVTYSILGYDNTTKNHVAVSVNSFDTSMNVSRGVVVDPTGKTQVMYGTLDEYMTNEYNKPYKVVSRVTDDTHHVMEIWDLGIGDEGAKVLEYRFTR